jgi:hypothetical protein
MLTHGVTEEQAKTFHERFWALHIDSCRLAPKLSATANKVPPTANKLVEQGGQQN